MERVKMERFPSFRDTMPGRPEFERKESANVLQRPGLRRRATSNALPGEPRGDTGGVSFATLDAARPETADQAAWCMQRSAADRAKPRSKRRKAKRLFRRWKTFSLKYTWVNPLILVLTVLSLYELNPSPDNPVHSALFLSYPEGPRDGLPSAPIMYGKGGRDFAFVAFYIVVLSFTREFIMQQFLRPLALQAGIKNRQKQSRFMEQFYTALYFGISGPFGLYVMSRTPVWYFNTVGMFEGFPHRSHEGLFKAYYLLQASYWAQQAIVLLLQLEKPRKDFKELVGHHITTLALIWCSYRFHFTYMGLAVYITHDISDFFLATSKLFNYLELAITGPYFGLFIVVWAYLRHYLNLHILYAVLTTFRTVGPFELNWETQQYKCWISQYITFGLLASLQSLNIFWFVLILRIAKRYIFDQGLEDSRSDYDEDEAQGAGSSTAEKREVMAQLGATGPELRSPELLLNGAPFDGQENIAMGSGLASVPEAAEPRRRHA